MDIPWDDVQLFLAIAETHSISSAAKRLRLGQPTVSRRLAQLEYALGYALFRRDVTGTSLTTEGERLLLPAQRMAEWAGEIARAASSTERTPSGKVRIAAAPGVGVDFLAPFAAWVRDRYPKLRIEVLTSYHYLDLARGEADLALRMRPSASDDLTTVTSFEHANAAFATPGYIKTLKKGYGIADVGWICWAPPYQDLAPNPQLEALIPNFVPSFTSDNFLVQWRAAESGMGAFIMGNVKHRFAAPSALVPLDLDLGPYSRSTLHLVCAKSALDIPRVRTVADLLAAELNRAKKR
ncbi:LysR family transcriptional regulator [Vulgatibacter incomptus]|uniref:Transcriptional regulator, LysR family n=1 Tax=Vulgatibacter incomptus TaxID=1391653 RepID=A0A0K1PH80_9BACT|nr:LysR family transcriptional regulator [Vulgatibacter incomptus]AKU92479.1 Transcriptional regulator, LysR family [Vulgatibacter incomptus]